MIRISHLNKIYKSKKRKECHALQDINLILPDAGLVFVLGKSGSGKSTLLNLIGGLDNITDGSIEVDGNDLAKFREKDFCNYRNSHIGFIFQDYHLIDELTVYENIRLSLDLESQNDNRLVQEALARVDLSGYEDRYPNELSGGEQQRVAIARAIVKKPRIILADEPTGNLDTSTATAIVTLLKELSKECLILIVSHNVNDANSYADRIIELRKGQIISDKSRNPEFLDEVTLEDSQLIYPQGLALSDADIEFINNNLTKFKKKTDKFLPTCEPSKEAAKVKIENKNLSLGKELNLSGRFLKNKAFAIAASSFMVAVIMIIMALAQTIINFDAGRILQEEMKESNQESIWLNKIASDEIQQLLEKNYRVHVGKNDAQMLIDAGYKGDIYPVLNQTVAITSWGASISGTGESYFKNSPYIASAFGTIIVGEDFLSKKFGDYEYLARVDDFIPYGVIITDYLADAILLTNQKYFGKAYDDILGEYIFTAHSIPHAYINGIIKTDYKERYKDLFDKIESNKSFNITDYYEDERFRSFVNEIYDCLGYTYTTNTDFVESYKNSHLTAFLTHYKLNFNGLIDFTTTPYSYVIISTYQSNYKDTQYYLAGTWYYTDIPPEIPEGAKYMRVAFNNGLDNLGGIYTDITKLECATLIFSDGTVVPSQVMNAITNGFINAYDGTVFPTTNTEKQCRVVSDYIEIPEGCTITEFVALTENNNAFCAFYDENQEFISSVMAMPGEVLPEASVKMNINHYNELFGTEYTDATIDSFIPHKVTLAHYAYDDLGNENPLFTKEVTIVGLLRSDQKRTMDVSNDVAKLFEKDAIFTHSLYLDGTDGIDAVLDMADSLNYEYQSITIEGIHTMTKAVNVFVPIFELVAILLCLGIIFILMNFSSKTIEDKMHEIGILKALGTKNSSIGIIFGLQIALIAILTCVLATVGYYIFIDLANDVLFESMKQLVPSQVVLDLDFLAFKHDIAIVNCILIFALSFASLVLPMIKIKAIKPVKIIKAKE